MSAVSLGQVWADNDKRAAGRKIRVAAIDDQHAVCRIIADRDDPRPLHGRYNYLRPAGWTPVGRMTRIALRRFRPSSNGYRLDSAP